MTDFSSSTGIDGPWRVTVGYPGSGPWDRIAIEYGPESGGTVICTMNKQMPGALENAERIVAQHNGVAQGQSERGNLGAESPANYRLAFSKKWTPDQFWEYVGGYAGEFEAGQMRDTLAERGLQIVDTGDLAYTAKEPEICTINSLVLIRNAVVMAIAFLGRDAGSDRAETTTPQIIKALANADTEVRRVLALSSTDGAAP
jgi:hypothetical protein